MTAPLPRILLVEPQFVLRRTIALVARDLGVVDFCEASDVARARVLLAAESFDGLVLDLAQGPQAMALLGELRQGQFPTAPGTPVIVLVADAQLVETASLQALGVHVVMGKPVRINGLINAIVKSREQGAVTL